MDNMKPSKQKRGLKKNLFHFHQFSAGTDTNQRGNQNSTN